MSKIIPDVELKEFSDTTTLVNYNFHNYGEISVWDGEALFDIKTICLTIADDMELILTKMREMDAQQ